MWAGRFHLFNTPLNWKARPLSIENWCTMHAWFASPKQGSLLLHTPSVRFVYTNCFFLQRRNTHLRQHDWFLSQLSNDDLFGNTETTFLKTIEFSD